MQQWLYRKVIWGGMVALGLVISLTCAYAGTTSPASAIVGTGKTGTPAHRHRAAGLGHQLHLAAEPQRPAR